MQEQKGKSVKVLALESSTSSAKAMRYDTDTGAVEIRTQPYRHKHGDPSTQDAQEIFFQTADIGKALCAGRQVDAIALSGAWHSMMLCGKDMTPVTPVYQWSYTGASTICEELRADEGFVRWFYNRTGCMVNAIYPAFKLRLLAQQGYNLTDSFAMGQGTYNYFRLTGQCTASRSMVSGTGLLNTHTGDYDDEVLAFVGIGREQLPQLTGFNQPQPLSAEGAAALGMRAGIPVVPAGPDGGLNQLGAGASEAGVMTFSVGTSGAMRLTVNRPVIADDHSLWCYISPISWLSGAATSGCCNCVDWAKQRLFPEGMSYADIEKGFHSGPEYTPVFLPFLFGERCPGWNDARQAAFEGVLPQHDAYDLYHSVLEGTLYNLYQCFRKLCECNGVPRQIKLSGGILHSAYWTQMCADIFGAPMMCADIEHGSLIGGTMLALGVLGLPGESLLQRSDERIVSPDPAMTVRYREKFERYLKAYEGRV